MRTEKRAGAGQKKVPPRVAAAPKTIQGYKFAWKSL
jgi:hypothetical protein